MELKGKIFKGLRGALLVALTFWATSCDEDKYLRKIPPTQISAADAFSTADRIEGLTNGIYSSLKGANFYGGRLLLFRDAAGEDFINTGGNSFTGFDAWNHSYSSGAADITNVWSAGYTTINRANILIDGLAQVSGTITEAAKTVYIGEAKFLRALSFFTLVTAYAQPYNKNNGASPGIPLRLKAEVTPDNNNLARSTVAEVYAQIIKDLDDAETALRATNSNDANALLNVARAHRNSAIALKTRVYLNQGNYAKVLSEAVKIVPQTTAPFAATSGVPHALQSGIVNLFTTNYTTTESIFSMPFTNLDMLGGQSALGYMYFATADYILNTTQVHGNAQWTATDARRGFINSRVVGGETRYYLNKFGTAAPFLRYMPVIRYSEVLLNYAEAAARVGGAANLALATALLKSVHARSDAAYTFPASPTQAALIEAILMERRIELLGEGFRANDILRQVIPFPAKVGTVYTTPVVETTAPNYIWPMSNDELLNNGQIN